MAVQADQEVEVILLVVLVHQVKVIQELITAPAAVLVAVVVLEVPVYLGITPRL
jgi:hypothetical protein